MGKLLVEVLRSFDIYACLVFCVVAMICSSIITFKSLLPNKLDNSTKICVVPEGVFETSSAPPPYSLKQQFSCRQ